jgi:hypothetical protein
MDTTFNCAPLYHCYPRQIGPQDAYLEIDKNGEISVYWNPEIGNAIPARVYSGQSLRYSVSCYLRQSDIDDLVADVAKLVPSLRDEKDDENCLSDEGERISREIELLCTHWDPSPPCYEADCVYCSSFED